jgi:hypothetical protein
MKTKQATGTARSGTAKTRAGASAPARIDRPPKPLLFEYQNEAARKVCIAGSFNDWKTEGLEMVAIGGGKWAKELLLPPGAYEYRFLGERNSVLVVRDTRTASA